MGKKLETRQNFNINEIFEGLKDELKQDMSENDLTNLVNFLQQGKLISYQDEQIEKTISSLHTYMNSNRNVNSYIKDYYIRIKDILKIVVVYSGKWFLIVSAIIYIFGFYSMISSNQTANHYTAIMVLAPIPFIIGLIDVFRSRNNRMEELEMSLKINSLSLMKARILYISVINILLNMILSLAYTGIDASVDYWKMTVYWCAPFFMFSSVSLVISVIIRTKAIAQIVLAIWVMISVLLLSWDKAVDWLESLNIYVYAIVAVVTAILLFTEIFVLFNRKLYDRGDILEAYYRKHFKTI